jgi:Spy/CpxP family protein refolding chaperone
MSRSFALIGVVVVVFAASGVLFGDDKDSKSDAKVAKQGALPANYGKLGLSDDQKKKIREIGSEYKSKIADLEEQIRELRKKERLAMENVLTDTQKARLRELLLEKAPGERDKK